MKSLILSFATAAIVVSGAQASYHTQKAQEARSALNQTYSPAALRALSLRSEAMNQQYQQLQGQYALELRSEAMNQKYQQLAGRPDDRSGVRGVESTSVTPDLAEIQRHVKADQSLSQSASTGPDNRAGIRGPGAFEIRTPQLVTVKSNGFDWKDAGIGAGSAFGITLVLMSGLAISRRRHSGLAV
ncbi:MAG: hypothetical protein WAQ33_12365 [Gaiellaceae bacterium]